MTQIKAKQPPKRFGENRRRPKGPVLWGLLAAALMLLNGCAASSPSSLSPNAPDARGIANLTWLMFAIAAVVFIAVTVLLVIGFSRQRNQIEPVILNPPHERRTLTLVLIFGGVLPAVVLTAVMALSVAIDNSEVSAKSRPPLTIEVVGHQWWWEVRYPGQNIITANEIHIPTGQPVEIKLTTADVIHSFWVPQLHGKLDTIPGQTNTMTLQADQAGSYRGQCAEYCGLDHAKMAFQVIAEDEETFNAWLKQETQVAPDPPDGSVEKQGQQAFLGSACTYCHTIRGTNASGTLGPDLTHIASRRTIGAGVLPNIPGNLAGWITNAQAIKPGNKMPPMDFDSVQIQQIIAYFETLK